MDFSTKIIIMAVALCVGSIWAMSLIKIVLDLLLAPKFGFKCSQISGFGLLFLNEEGKWKCKKDTFSPIIQEMIVIDISKPVPEDIDKKDKIYTWISYCICLLISVAVVILCMDEIQALIAWDDIEAKNLFVGSFAVGMLFHSLSYVVIGLYTYGILMKRLAGYTDVMIKKLRQGVSFEDMDLRPILQLPYNNPTSVEKMMYYRLYIPYLIAVENIEGLKGPMTEMTEYYAKRDYILQETLSYYWLIFYYSRYEIDARKANSFFDRVSTTLLNDSDANAKRVLAYYHYGVKNEVEKARQYIREGLSVIDKFSVPGAERELERKLLLDLDELILRRIAYEQGNNEKI